ncbi:hypothetical protein ACU3L3_07135 [Priestia endophytica]|jgi:hypothetical protein
MNNKVVKLKEFKVMKEYKMANVAGESYNYTQTQDQYINDDFAKEYAKAYMKLLSK